MTTNLYLTLPDPTYGTLACNRYMIEKLEHQLRAPNKAYGEIFLEGNFEPVGQEIWKQDLQVQGSIPESLNGVFMRVGPNPHYKPLGGYHW